MLTHSDKEKFDDQIAFFSDLLLEPNVIVFIQHLLLTGRTTHHRACNYSNYLLTQLSQRPNWLSLMVAFPAI